MKRRESARLILKFMWGIAGRYNADMLTDLWIAMDEMRRRYGDQFVAATIKKNPQTAELALIREVTV